MKYILKNLNLPIEVIDIIYSYLDYISSIKTLDKIWYKRLITPDFYSYQKENILFRVYLLKREESMLNILLKNKVYDMIESIHMSNLNKLTSIWK